jgi:hypothetical protein
MVDMAGCRALLVISVVVLVSSFAHRASALLSACAYWPIIRAHCVTKEKELRLKESILNREEKAVKYIIENNDGSHSVYLLFISHNKR